VFVEEHKPLGRFFRQDTILCLGDSVYLDPHTGYGRCLWQDGSSDSTYWVKQAGMYWLQVRNACGLYADSLFFEKKVEPEIELNVKDTIICKGDSITLEVKDSNATFLWSTGSRVSRIWAKQTGQYWVKAETECGIDRDTVRVEVDEYPEIYLPKDTILCDKKYFNINSWGMHIRKQYWNTGNLTTQQNIEKPGEYWVVGGNVCGLDTARIQIVQKYTPNPNLGNDTTICNGDRIELRTHIPEAILNDNIYVLWNDKVESQELYVEREGYYRVETRNACGTAMDTVKVEVRNLPELRELGDTIICDNTISYDFGYTGYQFQWQDGSEELKYRITLPGEYVVEITDELGCYSVEQFTVRQCPSEIWIPNAFTPNQDGKNEEFLIHKDGIEDYYIMIFDRWNKLVFESADITEGWNGNIRNEAERECAQGTYVYKIQFREKENNQLQIVTGNVNLLR
jgi:gliding motility-associated-like protein